MEGKTKNKKIREQIEEMAHRTFRGLGLADGKDVVTELKEDWFNAAYNIQHRMAWSPSSRSQYRKLPK